VLSFTFGLNYPMGKEPTAPNISKVGWTPDPVLLHIREKTGNKIEVNLHSGFQTDRQTDRRVLQEWPGSLLQLADFNYKFLRTSLSSGYKHPSATPSFNPFNSDIISSARVF